MHAPHTHSNHTQRLHLLARHVYHLKLALDELACETKDTLAQTNLFPDRSLKNKLTVGVNQYAGSRVRGSSRLHVQHGV